MRKLAVALSAALVLALAAPAMAASGLTIGGELGSDFTWNKAGVEAKSYFDIDVSLKGEGGENVKAVIELKPWTIGTAKDADDNWIKQDLADWSNTKSDAYFGFEVDKAYLQTEGAYWNGGPSVITTIGDITLDQSDYVASGDVKGVLIEGIELGPVAAETFATFANGAPQYLGLSANTDLGLAEIGGTVVHLGKGSYEFATTGSTEIAGVELSGEFASDKDRENAYKVRASVEPIEGVILSGGYRGADAGFEPVLHKTSDWDEVHDRLTGFDVAVQTTQYGVNLKASYDDPKNEAKIEASRAFDVAGLTINGEYTGTIENVKSENRSLKHEISADTTLSPIPHLQNVTLEGGLTIEGGSVTDYEAAAKYSAPNGIELGAHYDKTSGLYGTASVSVEF
ncbi:MAG: hypothetical protein H0Z38_08420 [Firmicutes bacterium]|nr:hypothetical protein [Bacillota bacterium]